MPINSGFYNYPEGYGPPTPDVPAPQPAPEPPRRPRRRGRGGVAVFLAFLVLMLGTAAAALVLNAQAGEGLPAAEDILGRYGLIQPSAKPTPAPVETRTPTTVERAEVGDGTTLTIWAVPGEEPHTYQDIYRENVDSIVGIRGTKEGAMSLGTGVVLSRSGYIVTNHHVIEGCSSVEVVAGEGDAYPAKLVGSDADTDLAVLKIEGADLPAARFGDSDALQVGDVALAIGNPLGENLKGTMTDGIISAISRDMLVDGVNMVLLQTTAALNSGNSGGALINQYGQVVGITNMKMSSYYDTIEGLGFAIPSATVKTVVDELIDQGHIGGRPTIGITGVTVSAQAASMYGFDAALPAGVWVAQVERASDAWAQGLRAGDVIVEADGRALATIQDLNEVKAGLAVGDAMALRVYRDGDYFTLHVKLVEKYLIDG